MSEEEKAELQKRESLAFLGMFERNLENVKDFTEGEEN